MWRLHTLLALGFLSAGLCVNPEGSHEEINGKCDDKPDGEYPLRNVMQFVVCKGGKSEVHDCPNNTLYGQGEKSCISADGVTVEKFCEERINGAWKNPWNCHHFIQCLMGESEDRPCTIKGEIYDPKLNDCTPKAQCVELPKKPGSEITFPVPPVVIANPEDQKIENKPGGNGADQSTGNDGSSGNSLAKKKEGKNAETHWYEEMHAKESVSSENEVKQGKPLQDGEAKAIVVLKPGEISVQEVASMLKTGNIKLIDVRNPWELKMEGKIGSSANIPLSEIESAFQLSSDEFESKYQMKKPEKSDCQIVLHCRSGVRSMKALHTVYAMGYTCAKSMAGGFEAWKNIYSRR